MVTTASTIRAAKPLLPEISLIVGHTILENVLQPRCPVLRRKCDAVRSEADRVVPATEHQEVEDLAFRQCAGEAFPQRVIDAGNIMQSVADVDQHSIPGA